MRPLAIDIWVCMALAYLFVSIVMWFVARVSPFEWQLSTICNQHCDVCNSCNHVDDAIFDCKCEQDVDTSDCEHEHSCSHNHEDHSGHGHSHEHPRSSRHQQQQPNIIQEQINFDLKESFDRYFKNIDNIEEINNILMDLEHRQHYIEQQRQQKRNLLNKTNCTDDEDKEIDEYDENEDLLKSGNLVEEEFDEMDLDNEEEVDYELVSYENDFTIKNCFWWAIGTLIQTSDLNPKVFLSSH
jgi:hypothetical protein